MPSFIGTIRENKELRAEIERLNSELLKQIARAEAAENEANKWWQAAGCPKDTNEQTTPKYGCGHPQIADQDGTLPECPFCAAQNR